MNKEWKILKSSYALKTPWLSVKKEKVRLPNGEVINNFYSVDGKKLVAILAINEKQEVLLVKQWRHAIKKETYDLPGGAVDSGEKPQSAAIREFGEETGYSAKKWKKIIEYYPDSGKHGDVKYVFLASGLKKSKKGLYQADETEDIYVKWMPLDNLTDGIVDGSLREATLQLAILYYLHFKKRRNN